MSAAGGDAGDDTEMVPTVTIHLGEGTDHINPPPYSAVSPANTKSDAASEVAITIPKETDGEVGAKDPKKTDEKKTEEEKKDAAPRKQVGFFQLFRYATSFDYFLMIVASISAAANGVTLPAFSLVFGELIDSYAVSPDDMDTQITKFALWLVYIGIASWVLSWLEMGLWMMTGENQAKRIREEFLLSLLRKEQAWLDKQKAGELLNRLSIDTKLVQDAIGDKVAPYIHHNCTFISGLIIGLVKGWQLALIIVGCTPLLAIAGAFMSKMMATFSQEGQLKYAAAGSVAEEVITQIRTVISMGGERREINRYEFNLHEATKSGLKKGWTQGFGMGNTWLVVFSTYALALWFGATLIADKKINPSTDKPFTGGDIISVFFAVIMGAFALGNAAPSVPVIASGRGAAYDLFEIIDRPSAIDPMNESGDKPEAPKGEIRFENVSFFYETRPTHRVLNEFSLTITPGQTVALCGSSGCGKSTIVSLLERFYDPVEGKILLDGRPLTNLNVKWWRNQIGLVRQEPVLFSSSIEENIRYGKPNATREEIESAAKSANIHDTIIQQPKGYETLVGEDGRMLSGGQKQRVAIARALIRDPLLLILDEATSALDPENELLVQAELDKLMKEKKRTTLVIAHRLSTIRNADLIVCMHKGRIVEIGKHDELLEKRGFYYQLVSLQYDNRHQSNSLAPLPLTRKRTESSKKDEEKTLGDLAAEKTTDESSDDKPKPEGEIILTSADLVKISPAPEEQKEIKEEKKDEKDKKPVPKAPFGRLLAMTGPDKWWFLVAVIGAIANGGIMPGFSQIFSEMVNTFYLTDPDKMKKDASVWSWIFFAIGVGALFFSLCQWGGIGVVGERLTHRLRLQSFEKLLSMDLSYYDDEENSSGVVLTRLANDAAEVKSLATGPLIQGLQTIALLVCGLVFAFYYGWKLALICLACGPLITAASAAQMKFVAGFSSKAKQAVEKAGEVANESILNMKTVASFSAEDALFKRFSKILEDNKAMGYRTANITGAGFGSSQFILFATYGLAFWYGGRMVHDGEMTFGEVMKVFFAIMMSAMGLGQVAQFAPDSQKANLAATEILKLLDRKSTIDSLSPEGATPSLKNGGNVEFNNIGFCYPARPDIKIFDGFQLNIPANKSIALVGASGSGKSTIIQLLLRFYDVQSGSITIDGEDIRSLNVGKYRSLIGFVQQEPVLFMGTIHENIKYGNPEASDEEVLDAAKAANIHAFIASQAKGYSTMVGQKGFDMSGGQKQRLAIARALLRKPRILLLDEATSALDAESEKLVEEAIHTVSKKCTTITIAHRLTSIKNVDQIVVLSKGKIVEGPASHDQLLKADGEYARMWYAQQKKTNH